MAKNKVTTTTHLTEKGPSPTSHSQASAGLERGEPAVAIWCIQRLNLGEAYFTLPHQGSSGNTGTKTENLLRPAKSAPGTFRL